MTMRIFLIILLCIFPFHSISAQNDNLLDTENDSVDSLFEESPEDKDSAQDTDKNDTQEKEEKENTAETEAEEPDQGTQLVDIVRSSSVSLSGNFSFNVGYMAGYNKVPWVPGSSDSGNLGGSTQSTLVTSNSLMGLNFRFAPSFRVFINFRFAFPTFKTQIGEFFADYSIKDAVFFRGGRQIITWGISRYYKFTNLTARLPDVFPDPDYNVKEGDDFLFDADSYSLKVNIPVGTGGFELLGFTRNGFSPDPYHPSKEAIGWGGTYNLAIPQFDWTIGSFYQKDLGLRGFSSFKTTLFKKLETYTEALGAYNNGEYSFGVNVGMLLGLFDQKLQLSGEYYYNGERHDLRVKGSQFPLIYGHNISAGIAYYALDRKLNPFAQISYNINENSGICVPGLRWNAVSFVTVSTYVPIVFGSKDGTYFTDSPASSGKGVSFVILVSLHGNF